MKRKLLLPFLFVATIFFSSCEKEATQENSTLTNDDLWPLFPKKSLMTLILQTS